MERRIVLWAAAISGVLGGVMGAAGVHWLSRAVPAPRVQRVEAAAAADDLSVGVEPRLLALEGAVRALERRRVSAPPTPGAPPGSSGPRQDAVPPSAGALVDDPVFEAAVRDIMLRAEEDRRAERSVRREDRARMRAERQSAELEQRLALRPEQKAKLVEITHNHWRALRQAAPGTVEGAITPEQRQERASKLREQMERQLQQVLDPHQMQEYQRLPKKLKIGSPGVVRDGVPGEAALGKPTAPEPAPVTR